MGDKKKWEKEEKQGTGRECGAKEKWGTVGNRSN